MPAASVAAVRVTLNGFDTHSGQPATQSRLLGEFAQGIVALRAGLQEIDRWNSTLVLTYAEFGRRPQENLSMGTDHGTATVALLMGGAVHGGRVIADWPGLKPNQLYQQRDLAPTTDLRAIAKGVLRDHLGLSEATLASQIFPGSIGVRPLDGLIA